MEKQSAVVPELIALVVEAFEYVPNRLDDWQIRQANFLGYSQNGIEIFDEIAYWSAGSKVTIDHAPTMFLERAAISVATGECDRHLGGIGAASGRKQKSLCDAGNVAGDHNLVGKLGNLSAANWTDVARPTHWLPDPIAFGSIEVRPLTPSHDRKRTLCGTKAAAGHGGIEVTNTTIF